MHRPEAPSESTRKIMWRIQQKKKNPVPDEVETDYFSRHCLLDFYWLPLALVPGMPDHDFVIFVVMASRSFPQLLPPHDAVLVYVLSVNRVLIPVMETLPKNPENQSFARKLSTRVNPDFQSVASEIPRPWIPAIERSSQGPSANLKPCIHGAYRPVTDSSANFYDGVQNSSYTTIIVHRAFFPNVFATFSTPRLAMYPPIPS